jgi:hypothetical protein
MATLTQRVVGNLGTDPTYVSAAAGGDKTVCGSGSFIIVRNGSGASITVTLVTPNSVDGDLAVADRTITIAAGADRAISLPAALYSNPADSGLAAWTYSAVTTVTVASLRGPA